MAYDPLIEAMEAATGTAAPTYMDDLASLVTGAADALAAETILVRLSTSMGLKVEAHKCQWMT
eukprot:7632058-Prorocentrum_lima.AAC.1